MMVKEIEKTGIPVVHVANMTPVSASIGCNRILHAYGIAYPMCNPGDSEEKQAQERYDIMCKAVEVLCTDIKKQTIF